MTAGSWDIEVVADSDTRWKWGASLAQRLRPDANVRIHGTLLWSRSSPSEQQLRDVGIRPASLRRANVGEAVKQLADTEAQVVVLACVGGAVQALLQALARVWSGRSRRPVVITGYVGLVYENVVGGLLARAGADIVLANSNADADRFRDVLATVGADPDAVVRTALPFLEGTRHDPEAAGRDRQFTLTFVTQPGVPETKAERRYLLRQLIEHATLHPDRLVIVKLRGRIGERTTHVEPFHYETLAKKETLPANLKLVYGAMGPVLDRTDLCVTVSSTAAVEAMHRGIPTGILLDFGVREALGNHAYLGSGAFTSWPAVHRGARPTVDPAWAARNGVVDADPYTALAIRVAALVADPAALPELRPWLNVEDSGSFLPTVLNRHGLDRTGTPLPTSELAAPSMHRRAARAAARRAYSLGVRVVEPRMRRIAQL